MKKLLIVLGLLFLPMCLNAQEYKVVNLEPEKTVIYVQPNLYKVILNYGNETQTGHILVKRDTNVKHGVWVSKRNKEVLSKAKYNTGELIWIELKNGKRYTKQHLKILRLQSRVDRLESLLVKN